MQYTAGQAAEATGKNIATITRAIKSGKISAQKDVSGAWRIDPSELHRLFPPVAQVLRKPGMQGNATPAQETQTLMQDNVLQVELATLRERIRAQDEILADRAETIADLRNRLDQEGVERRKLAAVLSDQTKQQKTPMPSPSSPATPRSWWRRLLGTS